MNNATADATKGYHLASRIYDPVIERFMKNSNCND